MPDRKNEVGIRLALRYLGEERGRAYAADWATTPSIGSSPAGCGPGTSPMTSRRLTRTSSFDHTAGPGTSVARAVCVPEESTHVTLIHSPGECE